jgi:hypothetical protein
MVMPGERQLAGHLIGPYFQGNAREYGCRRHRNGGQRQISDGGIWTLAILGESIESAMSGGLQRASAGFIPSFLASPGAVLKLGKVRRASKTAA